MTPNKNLTITNTPTANWKANGLTVIDGYTDPILNTYDFKSNPDVLTEITLITKRFNYAGFEATYEFSISPA